MESPPTTAASSPDGLGASPPRWRFRTIFALGLTLLLLLHIDFWRPQRAELWWGMLPESLLYRLAWIGIAWLFLLWLCARPWQEKRGPQDAVHTETDEARS